MATSSLAAGQPFLPADADARIDRLGQWMKAAAFHEPGTADERASLVGSWTNMQVRVLWIDANLLVQVMRNPSGLGFSVRPEGQSRPIPVRYTPVQLHRIRVLACAAAGVIDDIRCVQLKAPGELDDDLRRVARLAQEARTRGDGDNYLLRRGALLQSDVAMLVPPTFEPIGAGGFLGPQRIRMHTSDGLASDLGQVAVHWELARMLLDYVRPSGTSRPAPERDEMVRAWYRATAAWMQATEQHDTLHLDRAREIFPNADEILFLSACQHEVYAGAPIQSAMRSAPAPSGWKFDVVSERTELHQAEALFRRALAANPMMTEARIRYGRVLSMLDHHADAANELRQALRSADDVLLRYYGELFLGAAEEALRNFDAARDAYMEARRLFPNAQSPRIALSALGRRRGDRGAALREMQQLFELSVADTEGNDPWWRYYVVQARNADSLLDELHRPFRNAQ